MNVQTHPPETWSRVVSVACVPPAGRYVVVHASAEVDTDPPADADPSEPSVLVHVHRYPVVGFETLLVECGKVKRSPQIVVHGRVTTLAEIEDEARRDVGQLFQLVECHWDVGLDERCLIDVIEGLLVEARNRFVRTLARETN